MKKVCLYPPSTFKPLKVSQSIKACLLVLALLPMAVTTGCDSTTEPPANVTNTEVTDSTALTETDQQANLTAQADSSILESSQHKVDWSVFKTDVDPVDSENFDYPFALDSEPVKSYADMFGITPEQARHSLTVGTASNEALTPIFDALGNHYVSHKLTDGADVKLIVYTTNDIEPTQLDYVFTQEFAKGLILPIEIQPKD